MTRLVLVHGNPETTDDPTGHCGGLGPGKGSFRRAFLNALSGTLLSASIALSSLNISVLQKVADFMKRAGTSISETLPPVTRKKSDLYDTDAEDAG